jgi:pilus assembly protein Flp/PilA
VGELSIALSRSPSFFSIVLAFIHDEQGATAIEYGLIAALIALVIIGAMSAVFNGIGNQFNNIGNNLATH